MEKLTGALIGASDEVSVLTTAGDILDRYAALDDAGRLGFFRHLADDLRTFYHEAIAAQPGPGAPNHAALNDWIFSGTALGQDSPVLDEIVERGTIRVGMSASQPPFTFRMMCSTEANAVSVVAE